MTLDPQNRLAAGRTSTGQFAPGTSGNPGGRHAGLAKAVRQLVGNDGEVIAKFWLSVLNDSDAKTSDRIDVSRLLADRGWGKAPANESPQVADDYASDARVKAAADRFKREVERLAALRD